MRDIGRPAASRPGPTMDHEKISTIPGASGAVGRVVSMPGERFPMSVSSVPGKPRARSLPFPRTSVGAKLIVALTGVALVGFVIVHMLGNLQIFLGREAINRYAALLKSSSELLWVARIGLLVLVVVHIVLTIQLRRGTFEARQSRYVVDRTIETSTASRYMLLSGLVVLFFIAYHLAHFTAGLTQTVEQVNPATGAVERVSLLDLHDPTDPSRHDVYAMVIHGFQNPLIVGLYVVANLLLAMHLFHGASSMLQTLGLNTGRNKKILRRVGPVIAGLIAAGNITIPVAIFFGALTP